MVAQKRNEREPLDLLEYLGRDVGDVDQLRYCLLPNVSPLVISIPDRQIYIESLFHESRKLAHRLDWEVAQRLAAPLPGRFKLAALPVLFLLVAATYDIVAVDVLANDVLQVDMHIRHLKNFVGPIPGWHGPLPFGFVLEDIPNQMVDVYFLVIIRAQTEFGARFSGVKVVLLQRCRY